jgi:hypothetical protein
MFSRWALLCAIAFPLAWSGATGCISPSSDAGGSLRAPADAGVAEGSGSTTGSDDGGVPSGSSSGDGGSRTESYGLQYTGSIRFER